MSKGKYEYWLSDDGLLLLAAWARDGLTDEQVAMQVGIGVRTLYDWKRKYPQIVQALKRGKDPVDVEVENSLLKRALGYEYKEVKEEYEFGELVKRTVVKKQMAPDTTAQIFWLKNRKPEQWREKREVTVDASINDNNLLGLFSNLGGGKPET